MGFRHILGLSFTFGAGNILTGISFSSAIHVSGKQVRGVLKTCRGVLMIGAAFG